MLALSAICAALSAWLVVPAGDSDRLRPPRQLLAWASVGAKPDAAPAPARAAVGAGVGLVVVLFCGGFLGLLTPVAAILAGVGAFVGLGQFESRAAVERRRALALSLPDTLDLMASALESGSPLRLATERVAEVCDPASRQGLDQVLARMSVGVDESTAWRVLAADAAWGDAARDIARSAQSGTAIVEVLRVHADAARSQRSELLEQAAKKVGVRSVLPLMCCYLPAFIALGVVPIVAGIVSNFLAGR